MFKISASYKLILSIFLTTMNFHVANAQTQAFDEGFLQGLKPAMFMMTDYTRGYGDIDYHTRTFEIRRNVANKIARGIESETSKISNALLRVSLQEVAKDIRSAPQGDYGDVNYHIAMIKQQNAVLVRVSEKVERLNQLVVQQRAVTSEREIGYLKGLRIAFKAMSLFHKGYGEIDYHIRTFELVRNMANKVAQGIISELDNIENPLLRTALNELAKDITSAPQGDYGDINYHVAMIKQQNTVLVRVAEKLESLLAVVESTKDTQSVTYNARSCSALFGN